MMQLGQLMPAGMIGPSTPSMRMISRDRTSSATVGATSIVVETSHYEGYRRLEEFVRTVLEAVETVATIQGVERIALRYVNEVRIPGVSDVAAWEPFIDPRWLGPALYPDHNPVSTAIRVEYSIADNITVVVQANAQPPGAQPIVNPNGPLKIRETSGDRYFLLDSTGVWTPENAEVPRFAVDEILQHAGAVHAPLHDIFETAITDRLRDEVLRREP